LARICLRKCLVPERCHKLKVSPIQPENSRCRTNPEQIRLQLHLLEDAATRRLDGLECPQCGRASVSAWFMYPAADAYRTWFVCAHCTFITRAQNSARPSFFSEARVRQDLEERDLSTLNHAILKAPPEKWGLEPLTVACWRQNICLLPRRLRLRHELAKFLQLGLADLSPHWGGLCRFRGHLRIPPMWLSLQQRK